MPVKSKIDRNWSTKISSALKIGLLEMSNDILTRAVVLAPKETRALANSGVVNPISNGFRIQFGSTRVPYARRRHFENKKNPQTLGYLARAGDSVVRGDKSRYFRSKV